MPRPPRSRCPRSSSASSPGWGGAYLLPNLIGIENALEVVISNPLKQNRMLKPQQAFDYGIVDAIFPAANYLENSLRWADGVLGGIGQGAPQERAGQDRAPHEVAHRDQDGARHAREPASAPCRSRRTPRSTCSTRRRAARRPRASPARTRRSPNSSTGDQFAASMYAFDLVQKRAKRPVGAPDKELAKKVTKVGIIGAGLMASQFALLFVRKLQVPVLITDLDQARVDKGLAYIHEEIGKLEAKGRLDGDGAEQAARARARQRPTSRSTPTATSSSRRSSRRSASSSRCSARSSRSSPRTRSSRRTRRRSPSRRSARSSRTPSGWSASTSSTRSPSCRSSRS